MNHRTMFIVLFLIVTLHPIRVLADASSYSYGDPTDAEQAHLEAINRARLNPSAEAARLGIDLNEGLAPSTINTEPVQPLTMNAHLLSAARSHSSDMLADDYFSHYTQSNGDSPFDRMNDAGFHYYSAGENLAFKGSTRPLDEIRTLLAMHDQLFIDSGVNGRGHRLNILNGSYKEVGIGSAFGQYQTYTNSCMLTCDFGASSDYGESFLLGVVYDDTNSNNFYDAGEGVGSVTITVDTSYAETTTASAGGYGIPLPPGDYTVTATRPDGSFVEKSVTMAYKNIKIDFLSSEFSFGDSTDDSGSSGGGTSDDSGTSGGGTSDGSGTSDGGTSDDTGTSNEGVSDNTGTSSEGTPDDTGSAGEGPANDSRNSDGGSVDAIGNSGGGGCFIQSAL